MNLRSAIILLFFSPLLLPAQLMVVKGKVLDLQTTQPLADVVVSVNHSAMAVQTNGRGEFRLVLLRRPLVELLFVHASYQRQLKQLKITDTDSLFVEVQLEAKYNLLDSVAVTAKQVPETLVGKPDYSIYDFGFWNNDFILLTAKKDLRQAEIKLSDENGQILHSIQVPRSAGAAKNLFRDYEGFYELICEDSIFRIDVWNRQLQLFSIPKKIFKAGIEPVSDTSQGHYYFTNYWAAYPAFDHLQQHQIDSVASCIRRICDSDLMRLYNLEYYYLPTRMQLEARRLAVQYKTEPQVMGALMSGFTQSMYYDPLYAPLFLVNDTIYIFDHHKDHLYHYNTKLELLDSVKITYHHPKNWREWKKKILADEVQQKLYACYSKDGHHSLKEINLQNGTVSSIYRLQHHSASEMKIKDGYIYYVYRPFDSTQQKFLYRERITASQSGK